MAALETVDILKRDNATVLLTILKEKGVMTRGKNASGSDVAVQNLIKLQHRVMVVTDHNFACVRQLLLRHCETIKGVPPEVMCADGEWLRITMFFKDKRFVPSTRLKGAPENKDKLFQQRQEISLVDAINASQGITIPLSNLPIVYAEQAPDIGPHGKENLVDVVIYNTWSHTFNVSCKQTKAADLGGGGITGLLKTVPELVGCLFETTITDMRARGLEHGSKHKVNEVPQFQYKIPDKFTYSIFRGSDKVGGTIDYMYVGPADVVLTNNYLNGMFIPVEEYAKSKSYYFRMRKRDIFESTVTVDYEKLNNAGMPVLLTSGPMKAPAARYVVEDKVLSTAIVRELYQ